MRPTLTPVAFVLIVAAFGLPLGAQVTQLDARIAEILNLPRTVNSGREAGIPGDVIGRVLDSLHRRRVPAADAEEILRREIEGVRMGQPKDNFGAFVNEQLARGLRGRELAEAIHEEHARRGMGPSRGRFPSDYDVRRRDDRRPPSANPVEEKGRGKGPPAAPGRDDRRGSPDSSKGENKGRRP